MSALGDVAGPMMETPYQYIRQLCKWNASDANIAMHCNRMFGTNVKPARVAQIRKIIGEPFVPMDYGHEPSDIHLRKHAAKRSNAAFTRALMEAGQCK